MAPEMLIWQLADSAFPSGGFAHSAGLEDSWQQGIVSADSLSEWLEAQLVQIARAAIPFVTAAARTPEDFRSIDAECDTFINNHVANRASRAQGQALADTAARTLPVPALAAFRQDARSSPMHLPVVFGVVCRLLGIPMDQTAKLYVFITLRGWISAAVRLGIVGPMEGQSIQAKLLASADAAAIGAMQATLDQAAQTAPVTDILLAGHDRLYSRLFQS
jgi:urease accessory protein